MMQSLTPVVKTNINAKYCIIAIICAETKVKFILLQI